MKVKFEIQDKVLNQIVDRDWEDQYGYFHIDTNGEFTIIQHDDYIETETHPEAPNRPINKAFEIVNISVIREL